MTAGALFRGGAGGTRGGTAAGGTAVGVALFGAGEALAAVPGWGIACAGLSVGVNLP